MSTVREQYRIAKRDGEIIQQRRYVTSTTKNKWYKPWEYTVDYEYSDWIDIPMVEMHTLRVGDRVKVKMTAGFHQGATGEITFIEPRGRCWVTRDNSGSPVYYDDDELELIWRRPKLTEEKTPAEKVRELRDIQGREGNWDYDPYMQGMYNGLEVALCVLEDRDPEFKSAPKKWRHE